jgi:multidrug efflux pump subunit AcrB
MPSLNSDQTVKLSVENEPLKVGWHRGEFGAAISEDSLLNTVIKLREDRPILLRQVGQLVPRSTMARIDRVQQQYQRVVSFEFDGVSAAADRLIDDAIRSLRIPSGFQVSPRAPWVLTPVSNREIVMVGVGALMAVLIASAVVFESAIQPFIVLLATPLGLIGSASGAYVMGGQFSVEMLIGLILLFGVGASNAMMIVERFNWKRSQYQSEDVEADAVGATTHHFSAIVLTTLLAAAGIMPSLVPALGGSESLRAVGIVLALGLASSALLGVLVVPASLVFIARFGSMWSRKRRDSRSLT